MREAKRIISAILVAVLLVSTLATGVPMTASAAGSFASVGGWNETIYAKISGISDSDVTGVSYSGPTSGSLTGEDLQYLVREEGGYTRIDVLGLKPGTYTLTVTTKSGTLTKSGIQVEAQDRSGYAHFNYTEGVGAYNDDGTLKSNAIVLYVTDSNKNSVTVTSKDGTKVTGIGNILGSTGMDVGTGLNSKGGKANTNQDILRKLAADGTPLVVRLIGNVTAPEGLTAYDSIDYGGTEGDNGFMARMSGGKDITIEGVGSEATMNGWGLHFICQTADYALGYGKSFEVRNITFKNVPEDCVGMEGQMDGDKGPLVAPVERCWVHHCTFIGPTISNPAESDKDGGDGACDFKRGQYFTNSYCYYEGYHKTNLVGSSDDSKQYHLTYHHNYWKNCESRGPLARQADIHMYNNIFEGQTSYAMNPRANAYIFSEYNLFLNSKNPVQVKSGAVKSYNDVFTSCTGDNNATVVTDKSQKVSTSCLYANFDTDASVSYVPSGDYILQEDVTAVKAVVMASAGSQPATILSPEDINTSVIPSAQYPTAAVQLPYSQSLNSSYVTSKSCTVDNVVFNVQGTDSSSLKLGGNGNGCDVVFYVNTTVNISVTDAGGSNPIVLCNESGIALLQGSGTVSNVPAGYYFIQSSVYDVGSSKYKDAKVSALSIEAVLTHGENDHTYTAVVTPATCTEGGYTTYTCECGASYIGNETAAKGHTPGAAATCTAAQTCTVCGEVLAEMIAHNYVSGVCSACGKIDPSTCAHTNTDSVVTAPSCTKDGYTTYTCADCGHTWTGNTVAATGHTGGAAATCTTAQTCTVCGETVVAALGHSYSDGVCSVCGQADPLASGYVHSFDDGLPASGSFYSASGSLSGSKGSVTYNGVTINQCLKMSTNAYISFTAPQDGTVTLVFNSSNSGYTVYINGGNSTAIPSDGIVTLDVTANTSYKITKNKSESFLYYAVYTPAGGAHSHSYTSSVTTAATCTAAGVMTYTCSCGDSYTEAIPATGHSYTESVTAPTCTAQGYSIFACSSCGSSYKGNYTAALGHSYVAGICSVCGAEDPNSENHTHNYTAVVTPPTCEDGGYTTYTCACGDSYEGDETSALGHSYTSKVTAPTCTEGGYTTYTCSTCGDTYTGNTTSALGHSYTSKVTAPTCTEGGYTTYTCTCGDTYTADKTDALGHKYVNGVCSGCGKEEAAVEIKAFGHLESAYAEWGFVDGATGYNVYVQALGASGWTQLDNMLIRQYSDHMRADAVGLKAGKYVLKVVPLVNGTEQADQAMITDTVTVLAHDRSGYGFSASSTFKSASGAYNDDGTLKSDAQVIYVTADTAKTCTATVNGAVVTGFQSILDAKQKSGTTEPLCFRVVGLVTLSDLDHISSSSEGLQIKGKSNYNEMNITIEGIGEDAAFSGFGMLIRNCGNVEIRNLGFLNFMDDGISVDTNNCNLWVHNCDFFYGGAGSDADQAKGDGSLDTKKSQYISYSYNHFWDAGKVHLVGNGSSDSVNYLTFHHNWYDHADSRMPRVRSATAHVYNNFYDGVSKYGIGATMDSDIFSEANYFLNTRFPMLISNQGSDVYDPLTGAYDGEGTFSGETGGMIKSYADVIINAERFVPNSENATQFDAVVVENRNDTVSGVSAFDGGAGYSNFDTASGFYSYKAQSAADAMQTTKDYAGRINGGDLKFTFTDADNSDFDVNTEMKAAITGYKSSVVSIGGNSVDTGASGGDPTDPTEPDSTDPTDPSEPDSTDPTVPAAPADQVIHNFTDDGFTSTVFTFAGSKITNGKHGTYTHDFGNGTETLNDALKFDSGGSVVFTPTANGKLTIAFASTSSSAKVAISGSDGTTAGEAQVTGAEALTVLTVDVTANVTYTVKRTNKESGLYYIAYIPDVAEHTHGYTSSVVAPTCTAAGVRTYVCDCGDSYTESIPATGHSYVDGACSVCGEADPDAVGLFDLAGANMALGNSLSMYLYVNASDVAVGDYYIEIVKTYADGRDDVVKTVPMSEWTPYSTMYFVSFDGVAAKEMTDDFHVTVYHADGTQASNTRTISIEAYAISMLNRTDATSAATHNLMADMLNYGAAAQQSFKYAQNKLANANMTAAHKACGTQNFSMDQFSDNTVKGTGFVGANLSLESSICMYLYFDQNIVDRTMTARVSYTNHNNKAVSYEIPGSEFTVLAGYGFYGVEITTLTAADAESMVTVEILDGSKVVASGSTSVESLAARGYAGVPLYVDLMKFCTAAYNYFH